MNDLTLSHPRRCPVCERLVPGPRCPLDDAVTEADGDLGADDPRIGALIVEGFRAERRVPSCGGGVTYDVVQEGSGRRGVLRLLDLDEEESFGVADRFAKVYSSLFSLQHPVLPPVLRYGRTPEGRLYVVTGAPEGENLETLLRRGRPLAPGRAVAIALRLADALAAIHALGLVHGDVSPSRVWLSSDDDDGLEAVTLTDTGLFEVMAARPQASPPAEGGRLFCDPRTLSPEVAAGYSADARADLYALGVLLGMELTAEAPFEGSDRTDTLRKHLREPYPVGALHGLPEDLKRVVARLAEKSPNLRFQNAEELKSALKNTLDLIEMIGHDTDPDLSALAAASTGSTSSWGEMVTIGDDDGSEVQAGPLASPSVLLNGPPVGAKTRASARSRPSTMVPVLAATLIFLVVAGLVALRFLTSSDAPARDASEPLAALQRASTPPPVEPAAKSKPTAAIVTAVAEPAIPRPAPPPGPQAAPEPTKVVQMAEATPPTGQPIAVELRSEPTGAFVMRDGFKIGETPLTISLQSRKSFLVTLEKPGFVANAVEIVPEQQARYEVALKAAAVAAPAVAPAPAPAPVKAVARPTARQPQKQASKPAPKPGATKEGEGKKPPAPSGYDLF